MKNFVAAGYLILFAVAGYFLYRLLSYINETGKGIAGGISEFVQNPLTNPVSQQVGKSLRNPASDFFGSIFKSDAEKQVDILYTPQTVLQPPIDKDYLPKTTSNGDIKGIANTNPLPGPTNVSGRITTPSINHGGEPKAGGSVVYSGSSNPAPPVNNKTFSDDELAGFYGM